MQTPLTERPCCEPYLAKLKNLDSQGWCCATDGTLDALTDDEAISVLQSAIAHIQDPFAALPKF
jgi:hypothetical protein